MDREPPTNSAPPAALQSPPAQVWAERAAAAYEVLTDRFWDRRRRLFRVNTRSSAMRSREPWQYWWQAHALDAVIDAAVRSGDDGEVARASALISGIRLRGLGLGRGFYDDMAWLALALLRASTALGLPTRPLVEDLWRRLRGGFDERRGVVRWRRGDDFYNVPANGPVAILAARVGQAEVAGRLLDWMHEVLVVDGRVLDGLRGDGRVEAARYSYNYGTVIGADVALHGATGEASCLPRAMTVARGIRRHLADPATGLLPDEGGGDGGLFKGICARYLGELVAVTGDAPSHQLLSANGVAAWAARRDGLVGGDWARPPDPPVDLSQHLSGVMLFEALATLRR